MLQLPPTDQAMVQRPHLSYCRKHKNLDLTRVSSTSIGMGLGAPIKHREFAFSLLKNQLKLQTQPNARKLEGTSRNRTYQAQMANTKGRKVQRERERRRERDKSNDMGMNEAVVSEEEALKPAPGFKQTKNRCFLLIFKFNY